MPTLPNYSTRFNPRTGEQSYLDPGTNQWTPGLPTGQNVNPIAGMDLKVPSLPTLNPQQIQAMYGGGSNSSGAINSAVNPVGAGGMGVQNNFSNPIGNTTVHQATDFGGVNSYGPGGNLSWAQANEANANAVRNAVPQYVSPGVGAGGGMPLAGFPTGAPMSFGGGFGSMAGGMGGAAPLQAPAQRTRVYQPSFSLPRYNGRNT